MLIYLQLTSFDLNIVAESTEEITDYERTVRTARGTQEGTARTEYDMQEEGTISKRVEG